MTNPDILSPASASRSSPPALPFTPAFSGGETMTIHDKF